MEPDTIEIPVITFDAFDDPLDCIAEGLSQYRHAGLSDGRQTFPCPLIRTALPQLTHQDAVRQEDHIHVAGLTTAVPELTFAHAQMLLAVPMEALRPCPAATIHLQHTNNIPVGLITDQHLFGLFVILFGPQNHDSHLMVHIRNTDAFGKIPLLRIADADFFAILGRNLGSQFIGADVTAHKQNFTIELQIADVRPLVMMNVVQIGRIRKIAVKGEIAGDLLVDRPVHQPADELVVVDKLNPLLVAVFFLTKR